MLLIPGVDLIFAFLSIALDPPYSIVLLLIFCSVPIVNIVLFCFKLPHFLPLVFFMRLFNLLFTALMATGGQKELYSTVVFEVLFVLLIIAYIIVEKSTKKLADKEKIKEKPSKKRVIILVASVICYVCLWWVTSFHMQYDFSSNILYYEKISYVSVMPKLDLLQEYTDKKYRYYCHESFFYNSQAHTLLLTYEDDEYEKQKLAVQESYHFHEGKIQQISADEIDSSFTLDGFEFNTLDFSGKYSNDYKLQYPKSMCFIGFNNDMHQIVYIYFHDTELDFISDNLAEFIKDDCNWEYPLK